MFYLHMYVARIVLPYLIILHVQLTYWSMTGLKLDRIINISILILKIYTYYGYPRVHTYSYINIRVYFVIILNK